MTASYSALETQQSYGRTVSPTRKGSVVLSWITTTDHKTVGYLYLITSFLFFCLGGVMALVIRAQLFQPFVTAGKRNGLGLGLALSRQTVLEHGGDMWVESEPGRGARFVFRLPGAQSSASQSINAEALSHGD